MHPHRSSLWLSLVLALALPIDSVMTIAQAGQAAEVNSIGQTKEERKADGLLDQGFQQFKTNQFDAALQSWQQALSLYRAIKNRQGEGSALGNLGLAYYALGNYAKAIDYLQQWLTIAREIKDLRSIGMALSVLGDVHQSLSNYAEAIEYYNQILPIARELHDLRSEGEAHWALGVTYGSLSEHKTGPNSDQKWRD
jgi:tetratricopeptide (TPR) repeat protein